MMRITRFLALSSASALAAFGLLAVSIPSPAQSPVVQPQYFGASVNAVVAVDLDAAASRPLGQSAFSGGQTGGVPVGGSPSYGQRVQVESSPQMFTGVSGLGRPARP